MIDKEIWRPIELVAGRYEVSTHGRIRHAVTKKIKNVPDSYGYKRVCLFGTHYQVHRLVAMAFIPNPDNLPYINHKNEIKNDNRADNLEWCTHAYNIQYSLKGKHLTPETKAKISATQKGKRHTPETKAKISAAHRGKHWFKCAETGKHIYY